MTEANSVTASPSDPAAGTAESILAAAEAAFADPAAGTSARAIAGRAGVSAGVVQYHFGSRAGLLRALALRRLASVRAAQDEALDALLRREAEPPLEALLAAVAGPVFDYMPTDPVLRRLAPKAMMEPDVARDFRTQVEDAMTGRLRALLIRRLTYLPHDEAERRIALAFSLMDSQVQLRAALGEAGPPLPALDDVVRFAAAGLRSNGEPAGAA